MSTHLKKIIRIATYGFLVTIGFLIALLPFLKKKEFTDTLSSDFSPSVREVNADIPSTQTWLGGDGDDDGGGI